jgi:hypothetical protein
MTLSARPPTKKISASPYRLLPLAVFIFFALSFVLHPESPLRNGQLLDPDDYMRLNEAINWLQSAHPLGSGWFDLSYPRLDPGHASIVHWARLVDLPIALFMLPFIHAFGMQNAALIASFIVPPLLFIVLLMLMPALARSLIEPPRNNLASVFLLFAPAVLMNFLPGRVDHHGWQIIIAAFGLLCLERMIASPRGWRYGIFAAIAFACGLWIGTEALPWLALFCACLALIGTWRGGFVLRNAAIFGLALPIAIAIVMPLALPPSQYFSHELSWFSGVDLICAALAGAVFIGSWLGGRATNNRALRFCLMLALGFCASALFAFFVPDLLTGAYADYDTFFNETLINNISEAQPLIAAMHINIYYPATFLNALIAFLRNAFLPFLASLVVIWNLFRADPRARAIWLTHAFFLLPALLMTIFWQVRVAWFAQIFSIVPVAWLAVRAWDRIGTRLKQRQKFWAEIAAFLLIAPLPVILLPAITGETKIYPDLLLFPAAREAPVCPLMRASEFLNDNYRHPRLILSGENEGPELLFRTGHKVLAAPYDIDGNEDAFDFFRTTVEGKARAVIRQRRVDLVLVCRAVPLFYEGLDSRESRFKAHIYMDSQGILRMTSSKNAPTMIERLLNGDYPSWLNPIEIPLDPNYLLFEVSWIRG